MMHEALTATGYAPITAAGDTPEVMSPGPVPFGDSDFGGLNKTV